MSIKKIVFSFAVLAVFLGLTVSPASAQTVDINTLLQQIAALQAQIASLSGMPTGTPAGVCNFSRDLSEGKTGDDVTCLQNYLKSTGHFPAGTNSTGFFGPTTKASVIKWQTANSIAPASGLFGTISQTKYYSLVGPTGPIGPGPITTGPCTGGALFNSVTGASCTTPTTLPAGCTTTTGFSPTTGLSCGSVVTVLPAGCTSTVGYSVTTGLSCAGGTTPTTPTGLTGAAGSVSDYTIVSGLNNEDVGEDAKNISIAGLDVEADDGSDLAITAVKVIFDEYDSGTTSDFDNYASEVSIWLDGKEYARVNASDFTDDNAWTKTISLSDGAIIRAGKTGQLLVKVSGIGNLDTSDAGDDWDLDFNSVRFVDGRGDSTSEDPGTAVVRFYFQSFATASDSELKIAEDSAAVNTAHVIEIDASADTNNEPLLSFTLEAKGDSDLELKKLFASTTVTGASNVDDMISDLKLVIDGQEYGTLEAYDDASDDGDGLGASLGASEQYMWKEINYTIPAGTKVKASIKADIYPTSGSGDLDAGDTILATITSGPFGSWDVRDESNTKLTSSLISGSATGEANAVYAASINATFVSSSAGCSPDGSCASSGVSGGDDTGSFKITFDVKAFGNNIYVDGDVVATATAATLTTSEDGIVFATSTDSNATSTAAVSGVQGVILCAATSLGSCTLTSNKTHSSDVTTSGAKSFYIQEGDTRRFTLEVIIGPMTGDISRMGIDLKGISWDTDSGDAHANSYTFDLGGFKTDLITLNQT
ncbi:MAG: peptidoglycan-binding protein [Patescibacteria group bacterium]